MTQLLKPVVSWRGDRYTISAGLGWLTIYLDGQNAPFCRIRGVNGLRAATKTVRACLSQSIEAPRTAIGTILPLNVGYGQVFIKTGDECYNLSRGILGDLADWLEALTGTRVAPDDPQVFASKNEHCRMLEFAAEEGRLGRGLRLGDEDALRLQKELLAFVAIPDGPKEPKRELDFKANCGTLHVITDGSISCIATFPAANFSKWSTRGELAMLALELSK